MKSINKQAMIASMMAGTVALVAGFGGTSMAATKTVSIQLWESHSGGPVADAMTALVNRFDASHKNTEVKIYETKASAKALAAAASGNPPVLAEISHYIGQYLSANALAPWNTFITKSTKQTFYPGVLANSVVNGKLYRYPADVKVEELYYNVALFKKAGIAHPPETWGQLAVDLGRLKKLGVIPMGFKDSSAHILSAFMSNGGTLYSNKQHTAVNFDNAAGQTTFTFFRGLYNKKDFIFSHGSQMRADFGANKMAIVDGTSAGYQKILASAGGKFKVGAFAFPKGTSGHFAAVIQGLGFTLFHGPSKADQEAAWTFVHWFNEPKQQAYWAMHSGFAPTSPAGAAQIPKHWLASNPGEAVSIQILSSKYAVRRPNQDAYSEVQSALDSAFFNAVTGKSSVPAALKTLDTTANQYLKGQSAL